MATHATVEAHDTNDEFNPFLSQQEGFNTAADHLGLEGGVRDVLSMPDRELTVNVPVLMDDGRLAQVPVHNIFRTRALEPMRPQVQVYVTSTASNHNAFVGGSR